MIVTITSWARGPGLEQPDEAAPDGTADDAGQQDQQQVQPQRKVQREADPGREDAGHDDLALGADVEQAGAEGQGDAQAGRDQRGRDREGFQQRGELAADAGTPGVVHRALEQGHVGAGGGGPHGGEEVAGAGKEVARRGADLSVGAGDEQAAQGQREQHGEDGDHAAAGGDPAQHRVRAARDGAALGRDGHGRGPHRAAGGVQSGDRGGVRCLDLVLGRRARRRARARRRVRTRFSRVAWLVFFSHGVLLRRRNGAPARAARHAPG
ncbi:hypothetical protein QFZ79_004572 [Arthrobacter sp. V4I6]|nr:hypothetical protein [Arthrobacter sp. V4I6]